jgi:hypothetical protein
LIWCQIKNEIFWCCFKKQQKQHIGALHLGASHLAALRQDYVLAAEAAGC